MPKYSVERFFRVYDDDNGCFYEIRPDSDGMGCVEVSYCDGDKIRERCLTVPPEMAKPVAEAIATVANEIAKTN